MDKPADGIERERVESSHIESIGYSLARRVLAVEFKGGAIFHYKDVPDDLALEFYTALSKGQYFNQHIRKKFVGEKMTGPCHACGANGVIGETCDSCGCDKHYRVERRPEPTAAV